MLKRTIFSLILFAAAFSVFAKSHYSDKDEIRISQAIEFMDSGNPGKAILILDSLINIYPGDVTLLYEKAYAHHKKGEESACAEILRPLYDQHDNSDIENDYQKLAFSLLGSAYFNMGEIDKSDEVFKRAISLWPDAGLLYYNYGVNNIKRGDNDKALDIFKQGIKNAPEWLSNYRGAASILMECGSVAESICCITTLALLDPDPKTVPQLLSMVPKLVESMVKEKDDGDGFNITINADSNNRASDLMMALSAAASSIREDGKKNNKLDSIVNNLTTMLDLNSLLDYPIIDYLKAMEDQDDGMPKTFWYLLMGQNYPLEFGDWSNEHTAELSKLSKWISENPFPL